MGTSPSQNSRINFYCKDNQKLNTMNMLIVLSLLAIAVGYSHAAVNLALGQPTRQINEGCDGASYKAVDGIYQPVRQTPGLPGGRSCTHTGTRISNPWWVVDLGKEYFVKDITVYNRERADYAARLKKVQVGGLTSFPAANTTVSPSSYHVCGYRNAQVPAAGKATLTCPFTFRTRYVIVQLRYFAWLTLCEVEVTERNGFRVRFMTK